MLEVAVVPTTTERNRPEGDDFERESSETLTFLFGRFLHFARLSRSQNA
jgi:hypothetical protein